MYSVTVPQPKLHNGLKCYELLSIPCLSTVSLNQREKLLYPEECTNFVIDAVVGSWKHPNELQFNSWSWKAPAVVDRAKYDSEYFHNEPGRLDLSHDTADLLRTLGDQVDTLINYSEPVVMYSVNKARVFNEKSNLAEMLL